MMINSNSHGTPMTGGAEIARQYVQERVRDFGRYAASIQSQDDEWSSLEGLFHAFPVDDRIAFLGVIYHSLDDERCAEYEHARKIITIEGRSVPAERGYQLENIEAQWVLVRVKTIYDLLHACGEVPDYTFRELMARLRTMGLDPARQYANAISDYFPHYSEDRWIDLYGTPEAAAASKFHHWTSFEWLLLEEWIMKLEQNYATLLEAELDAEARRNVESESRPARRPLRVNSTDTDVVRVMESMKRAGLLDPKTTGPQIVAAFEWIGKLNEKPGNYDSTKAQADHTPPSDAILRLIEELLKTAGPDVKEEVIRLCKRQ